MRDIVLNTWAVCLTVGGVVSVSAAVALISGNAEWFSRCGSIATILGLLLLIKHSVLCAGHNVDDAMAEKLHYRRNRAPPRAGSAKYQAELAHTRRILLDEWLGFGITLAGTVIWGYGDLLFVVLL